MDILRDKKFHHLWDSSHGIGDDSVLNRDFRVGIEAFNRIEGDDGGFCWGD
jgi:hypothetical protein